MSTNSRRGKDAELRWAKRVRGKRHPISGVEQTDVENDWAAYEVKSRLPGSFPKWLLGAFRQARGHASRTGKVGAVALEYRIPGHSQWFVCVDAETWRDLHGEGG